MIRRSGSCRRNLEGLDLAFIGKRRLPRPQDPPATDHIEHHRVAPDGGDQVFLLFLPLCTPTWLIGWPFACISAAIVAHFPGLPGTPGRPSRAVFVFLGRDDALAVGTERRSVHGIMTSERRAGRLPACKHLAEAMRRFGYRPFDRAALSYPLIFSKAKIQLEVGALLRRGLV